MPDDEQRIRDLIATWLSATAAGNLTEVLKLMDEDVVYLLPGQPIMRGRDAFAASFKTALEHFKIDAVSKIQEIQVADGLAYCWNHLSVTMTPRQSGASSMFRAGYTLTVLRKGEQGNWLVFRDANLLTTVPSTSSS